MLSDIIACEFCDLGKMPGFKYKMEQSSHFSFIKSSLLKSSFTAGLYVVLHWHPTK